MLTYYRFKRCTDHTANRYNPGGFSSPPIIVSAAALKPGGMSRIKAKPEFEIV